jgi:hypothetical protein
MEGIGGMLATELTDRGERGRLELLMELALGEEALA